MNETLAALLFTATTYATQPPPVSFQEGTFEAEVYRPEGYTAWYHGKSAPISCVAEAKPHPEDKLPRWYVSCIDAMTTAPVATFALSCDTGAPRVFVWDGVQFDMRCRADLLVGGTL